MKQNIGFIIICLATPILFIVLNAITDELGNMRIRSNTGSAIPVELSSPETHPPRLR